MAYFPQGYSRGVDNVDDFEDYDPTPYGGGYDMNLTYGRPLAASSEICYPRTSTSSSFHDGDSGHGRPHTRPSTGYTTGGIHEDEDTFHEASPHLGGQSHGSPTGYRRKNDDDDDDDRRRMEHGRHDRYGKPSHKNHDDDDDDDDRRRTEHGRHKHGKSSYKDDDDDDDDKPRYRRKKHDDDGSSEDDNDDDDDEKKHRRGRRHHRSHDED